MSTENNTNNNQPTHDDKLLEVLKKSVEHDPTLIPPQFNGDAEKYFASYKELQAAFTKKSQELAELKKTTPTPNGNTEQNKDNKNTKPNDFKIGEVVEDEVVTVSWDDLSAEFNQTGDVSAETKQKIMADLKITDARVVDAYIDGLKNMKQVAQAKAIEIAGGANEYNNVLKWASKNFTKEQQAAINQSLSSPTWEFTWTGLVTQYRSKAQSDTNNPIKAPVGSPNTEVIPYRTDQEYLNDLRDPRYRYNTDPDFVDLVHKRVALTAKMNEES